MIISRWRERGASATRTYLRRKAGAVRPGLVVFWRSGTMGPDGFRKRLTRGAVGELRVERPLDAVLRIVQMRQRVRVQVLL